MLPERLLASDAADAEPLQHWANAGLPVPPSWAVSRELIDSVSQSELIEALESLATGDASGGYWVMRQGPMNPGSLRESLVNLDSHSALASALRQVFAKSDSISRVVIQALPGRKAAGVLFTRHPVRQDLDHIIVEGVAEDSQATQQRLILHPDGHLAYCSHSEGGLRQQVEPAAFADLAQHLRASFDHPQAGEWIHDGQQLWLLHALPIGSLPSPREAWSRRAGFGLWEQAITPLWYTTAGRWLKTAFWRPLGKRLHWDGLANIEPYRRQHSHLYANSVFFRELVPVADSLTVRNALPPAWRPVSDVLQLPQRRKTDGFKPWLCAFQLKQSSKRLQVLDDASRKLASLDSNQLWRLLMQLDQVGEKLSAIQGWLAYIRVPRELARDQGQVPLLTALLLPEQLICLRQVLNGEYHQHSRRILDCFGPGDDPVFPRKPEQLGETDSWQQIPRERLLKLDEALSAAPCQPVAMAQFQQAALLRRQLSGLLRFVLEEMALQLVEQRRLSRHEDIWFLYFDELWQLWHSENPPPGSRAEKLGERKLRYLTSAHQGAPDWMIDQVAYGVRTDQKEYPVLDGFGLEDGQVRGLVRRIYSGWALNQIKAGDIIVLDQCEVAWLPWLALASGLVIGNSDPLNPAASLARTLEIPAINGVDDAMHCLVDEREIEIDGGTGAIRLSGR